MPTAGRAMTPLALLFAAAATLGLSATLPATAPGAEGKRATVRIWVSPQGSDAAAGTWRAPLATPKAAQLAARRAAKRRPGASVQVVLRGGTYRLRQPLTLTATDSGRRGNPVVYRARAGERPVLSGAVRVPGSAWRPVAGRQGVWRAKVGQLSSRELYVDGERATRAATTEYPAGFRPTWAEGGSGSGIAYVPTLEPGGLNPAAWGDPASWTNPADVEAVILTQWKTMSVPVAAVVPGSGGAPGLLRMAEPAWRNANVFRDASGQPGIWSFWQVTRFENALEFLDEPGEWYLDEGRGWLYYKPRPWQGLAEADVELPVLQTLVRGRGTAARPVRNLELRGLTFAGATWTAPSGPSGYVSDQGGFRLVGEGHQPNTIGHDPDDVGTPAHVSFRFARNLRLIGNRFLNLGAVGLGLGTGSQHNLVRGNAFRDIGSSAIVLSGISAADHHPSSPSQRSLGNRIAGNLIAIAGRGYPDAPGIFLGFSSGTRLVENTIEDVPWSGIAVGWGWGLLDPGGFPGLPGAVPYQWGRWETPTQNRNNVIARNTITGYLGELWDGGAIYTTGAQGTSMENGLLIEGNVAYGKRPNAGGNTFYTDGGSRYVIVRGNVSYANPIGETNLGPPPRAGDPLPYPAAPSLGNGLPYGGDTGGRVTYGDIAYEGNAWMQPPMTETMELANLEYELIEDLDPQLFPSGKLAPYSPQGYFTVCPYSSGGVSYPTNLTYSGNSAYPAAP